MRGYVTFLKTHWHTFLGFIYLFCYPHPRTCLLVFRARGCGRKNERERMRETQIDERQLETEPTT